MGNKLKCTMNRARSSTNIDKTGRNRLKKYVIQHINKKNNARKKRNSKIGYSVNLDNYTQNNTIFYAYRSDSTVMKTMNIDGRIGQILQLVMNTMTIDRNTMGV